MSIGKDKTFMDLFLDACNDIYWCKDNDEFISYLDKYIEDQRQEAVEEFKQSDEYSSWRIY